MIRRSVVCHLKKNLFQRYHKFPQTKPQLDGLALASLDTRPGQSPHEAGYLAWLGLAYFGLALAGSRPQAGPGKTLRRKRGGQVGELGKVARCKQGTFLLEGGR